MKSTHYITNLYNIIGQLYTSKNKLKNKDYKLSLPLASDQAQSRKKSLFMSIQIDMNLAFMGPENTP